MITLIIITSYIAHVFLCRLIFKKAYLLNRDEDVKDRVFTSFIPIVGLVVAILSYTIEIDHADIEDKNNSWFNGKNW